MNCWQIEGIFFIIGIIRKVISFLLRICLIFFEFGTGFIRPLPQFVSKILCEMFFSAFLKLVSKR